MQRDAEPADDDAVLITDHSPARPTDRAWLDEAVRRLRADANRSADTHLVKLDLSVGWDVDIYLKDESTHPTGSLKHRLARLLFLYALCNGYLREATTVIEASSGSTAVSEAYFARMLGLLFVAVMHQDTSPEKLALIEREGGRRHGPVCRAPAGLRAAGARSQRIHRHPPLRRGRPLRRHLRRPGLGGRARLGPAAVHRGPGAGLAHR